RPSNHLRYLCRLEDALTTGMPPAPYGVVVLAPPESGTPRATPSTDRPCLASPRPRGDGHTGGGTARDHYTRAASLLDRSLADQHRLLQTVSATHVYLERDRWVIEQAEQRPAVRGHPCERLGVHPPRGLDVSAL